MADENGKISLHAEIDLETKQFKNATETMAHWLAKNMDKATLDAVSSARQGTKTIRQEIQATGAEIKRVFNGAAIRDVIAGIQMAYKKGRPTMGQTLSDEEKRILIAKDAEKIMARVQKQAERMTMTDITKGVRQNLAELGAVAKDVFKPAVKYWNNSIFGEKVTAGLHAIILKYRELAHAAEDSVATQRVELEDLQDELARLQEEWRAGGYEFWLDGTSPAHEEDIQRAQQLAEAIAAITQQIQEYQNNLNQTSTEEEEVAQGGQTISRVGGNSFRRMLNPLRLLRDLLHQLRNLIGGVGRLIRSAFASIPKVIGGVVSATRKVIHAFKKVIDLSKQIGATRKNWGLLNKLFHHNSRSASSFGQSLKRLSRTFIKYVFGVRSFFFLYRKIRKAIGEGLGSLALVSSETNKSISDFKTALNTLKGAATGAFNPILNAAAPVLTKFINLLADAINAVGMFIARLTGKSTYMKAVSVQQDYAASLEDTSNAANDAKDSLKDYLSGLDEIKKWESAKDSGSGSGGGSGGGNDPTQGLIWEEVEIPNSIKNLADTLKGFFENQDWEGLGEFVAEKINGVFEKLYEILNWENAGPKLTSIVNAITTTFNSLVDNIDWDLIGRTFGTGVNTLVNTLDLLLTGVDWTNLGSKVATGLRGFINEIDWEKLGKTTADGFNTIIKAVNGFVTTMSTIDLTTGLNGWQEAGKSIGETINGFISNIEWDTLGQDVSEVISGALSTIATALEEIDWIQLGEDIKEFFVNIDWESIAEALFEALGAAIGGLAGFLIGLFKDAVASLSEWWNTNAFDEEGQFDPGKLLSAIAEGFKNLGTWCKEHILDPLLEGIAKALKMDPDEFKQTAADVGLGILNGIASAFINLKNWVKENILDPIIRWFKDVFNINSPSTNTDILSLGENTGKGILNGIASVFTNLKSWIQQNILDKIVGAWNKLTDTVVEFTAEVKNDAATWWSNVKSWWSDKVGEVAKFFTGVVNKSGTWWSDVNAWWDDKVGEVTKFFTGVVNKSGTWWSDVNAWWDDKVGEVTKFTTDVVNKSGTWWNNVKAWWKDKVGNVAKFTTDVANHAKTWWSNVKTWWANKVGNVAKFTTDVVNKSGTWWSNVKTWWYNTTFGKTVSSFETYVRNQASSWWTSVKNWWSATKVGQKVSEFETYVKNQAVSWWDSVKTWWANWTQNKSLPIGVSVNNVSTGGLVRFASGGIIKNSADFISSIPHYASGTTRPHGTMFVAGEAGPEIIGHINGQTEILNKSQIAAAIYGAVTEGIAFVLRQFATLLFSHMNYNTSSVIATLQHVQVPAIARGASLPSNYAFTSALSGYGTTGTTENTLRQIIREEMTGKNARYEFVAQLNRRTIFDEVIQEAKMRQIQTGRNPFEFA